MGTIEVYVGEDRVGLDGRKLDKIGFVNRLQHFPVL